MKKIAVFTFTVSALVSQLAAAAVALDPMAINAEPFKFVPTVAVSIGQDSNIYSASTNEVSSTFMQVAPRFDLIAQDRANSYAIRYALAAGLYGESNNNYIDHKLDVGAHIEPTDRFRFNVGAFYNMLHDDLGTAATEGLSSAALSLLDPDEYKQTGLTGGLEYGAAAATGQLGFTTGFNQKRYDSAVVGLTRDLDTWSNQVEFRLHLAPKTKGLVDLEYNKGSYSDSATAAVSDYTEKNALLGLAWESTAATTGKARIGSGKRETAGSSKSKLIWDLGVQWSPQNMDRFSFNTGKRFQDGNNATIIDSTNYSASWTRDWLDRLQSTVNLGVVKEDYQGITRDDTTKNYGAVLNYQMRRWFVLGGGVTLKDRSSSVAGFDYDRTVFSLNAQISL